MPVFDKECLECKKISEEICIHSEELSKCPYCGGECRKIIGDKPPDFSLKYNNKTDMCDWSGNTSRYWDDYKKMKEQGLKPRIPALDGDG